METTNEDILHELKAIREVEAKRNSVFSVIDKVILTVVTTCILGLFGFVWDINTRVALLEQKIDSNTTIQYVEKLEAKIEILREEVKALRISVEVMSHRKESNKQ